MDDFRSFLHTRAGRVVVIMIPILIIGAIVAAFVVNKIKHDRWLATIDPNAGEVTYVTDTVADVTIRDINEEPEDAPTGVQLIGFGKLVEYGYTYSQETGIMDAIKTYFDENYHFLTLSFVVDSFRYDAESFQIAYFNIMSDTSAVFRVTLDSSASVLSSKLIVTDASGKQLISTTVSNS